ncbi:hypothetical protein F442_07531 [Phytophthora nicotianae P10297]|uniref:Uncharacterized protein n=3 Tax=Phytophthora nicotianae TaxID=4792 RepID=V9FAH5_PHYNI|nr:hypothetical protein F443_07519 [Phytophthora nicotianae P1569]ETO77237.1 hypothetical protein F444_07534 [Phytophthora nicotianae P1976]ETP46165.1 hypothetical protein F442_07531 [Phytophthora nicotianae P10297]
MVDIRGPCAYDRCEALADEELVVEPCTTIENSKGYCQSTINSHHV